MPSPLPLTVIPGRMWAPIHSARFWYQGIVVLPQTAGAARMMGLDSIVGASAHARLKATGAMPKAIWIENMSLYFQLFGLDYL